MINPSQDESIAPEPPALQEAEGIGRRPLIPDKQRRIAKEVEDEIGSIFSSHDQWRHSLQIAIRSIEAALDHGMAIERKCSRGRVGRRLYLGRRLGVKSAMAILSIARDQLKKSIGRMDACSRLKDSVLEEVSAPGFELDR